MISEEVEHDAIYRKMARMFYTHVHGEHMFYTTFSTFFCRFALHVVGNKIVRDANWRDATDVLPNIESEQLGVVSNHLSTLSKRDCMLKN